MLLHLNVTFDSAITDRNFERVVYAFAIARIYINIGRRA